MSKGNRLTKGEKAQRWLTEQSVFPAKLRRLMEKRGVSQKDLGDAIGVTRQSVSMYAGGQTVPDIYTVQLIADYFGVKVGYLLSEEDTSVFYNTGEFKDICTAYAGKEMYSLFCGILSLTEEGRDKVAERVAELKEVPRYNPTLEALLAEKLAEIRAKASHSTTD